jgi:hypothetical protein
MEHEEFTIPKLEFDSFSKRFNTKGKNSDIGNLAIEIAKLWLISKHKESTILEGHNGADLCVQTAESLLEYEIKGTEDDTLAFNKLKVSGKTCYEKLISGMPLIRISKVRQQRVEIYTLKYGEDFDLIPEPRWSVKGISASE